MWHLGIKQYLDVTGDNLQGKKVFEVKLEIKSKKILG